MNAEASATKPGVPAGNGVRPEPRSNNGAGFSTDKGDVPQSLLDRYLIERDRRGRPEHFYRDHRTAEPSFRDHGRRLTAGSAYPDIVADMLKVAAHRGWTRLKVEGDEAFRREAWVQAQALGLQVRGYRPRDRDQQAAGTSELRGERAQAEVRGRFEMTAAVVRSLATDPDARRRLLEHAAARAGLAPEAAREPRRRERSR